MCQFHQRFTYSFYACRSQNCKKIQLSHKYLFTLSGSSSVKAVHRTLMKLSHGNRILRLLKTVNVKILCWVRKNSLIFNIGVERVGRSPIDVVLTIWHQSSFFVFASSSNTLTHTYTLSLSLSLSHTHTHTHILYIFLPESNWANPIWCDYWKQLTLLEF